MSKNLFRCSCEVAELARHLSETDELEFRYDTPRPTVIRLGKSYWDGQTAADAASAICTAEATEETVDENISPEIKSGILTELCFAKMIPTVFIFRWRRGLADGPPDPISNVIGCWSNDGESWHEATVERKFRAVMGLPTAPAPAIDVLRRDVVDLINSRAEETLARQLFREAWSERADRPRSALVIGVAAAEIGFKKLVGTLVPQAQWLMDEAQTPPLGQMVRKFLPTLAVKCTVPGRLICPPNVLLNQLDEAIKRRNKVVHAGQPPPNRNKLDDILRAVSDFLWICDVYSGQQWAHEYISAKTLKAWPSLGKRA
jgi:hypothetical protein